MDLMNKMSFRHNFIVLFHEKPFEKINGSGKHTNWSLVTNSKINLLSPGKTPMGNLQFLSFFINTIAAVLKHEALLRASSVSASNDLRIGLHEAPSAILSIFIGKHLMQVLEELENVSKGKLSPQEKTDIKLNVIGKIPEILLDNTDENRTSPFAFTGNKFEFRAVGSSANCASAMIVINTIVANQLIKFKKAVDARINKGEGKDEAILKELQVLIKASKKIRFEGNGYGDEWVKEAEKRGLSNRKDTPRALQAYHDKSIEQLFESMGVLSPRELEARREIEFDGYVLKIQIESRLMGDLVNNNIIPAVLEYQNKLIQNIQGMMSVFGEKEGKAMASTQIDILKQVNLHLAAMKSASEKMLAERKKANSMEDVEKKALAYCDKVKVHFDEIRYHADKLELIVEDELWPLPKFRELLFIR